MVYEVIPNALTEANAVARRAADEDHIAEADALYRASLDGMKRYLASLRQSDGPFTGERSIRRWLMKAGLGGRETYELQQDAQNIALAFEPRTRGLRRHGPPLLAIPPLWTENDALYEVYGAAWALSVYLAAIQHEFAADSDMEDNNTRRIREAGGLLQHAREVLDRCQPAHCAFVALTPKGMREGREEILRVDALIQQVGAALREIVESLK